MADKIPMFGRDAKIVLFYGGARVPGIDGQCLRWSAKEVSTKIRDGLVGQKRKRTDKKLDGYDVDMDLRLPDLALFNYLKAIDDARDNKTEIKELAVGLTFSESDAGFEGIMFTKATATLEMENGGQSELLKARLSVECEDASAMVL